MELTTLSSPVPVATPVAFSSPREVLFPGCSPDSDCVIQSMLEMKTSRRLWPDLWETNTFKITKDDKLIKIAQESETQELLLGKVIGFRASAEYDRFFRGRNARNLETRFALDIETAANPRITIEFNAIPDPDTHNSATDVRREWLAAVLKIFNRRSSELREGEEAQFIQNLEAHDLSPNDIRDIIDTLKKHDVPLTLENALAYNSRATAEGRRTRKSKSKRKRKSKRVRGRRRTVGRKKKRRSKKRH